MYIVAGVQPDAVVPFVTTREYVLVVVGVAVGLALVAPVIFAPLHE